MKNSLAVCSVSALVYAPSPSQGILGSDGRRYILDFIRTTPLDFQYIELVGADGATHQGLYDIAYLRCLPNMVLMAPKDENELRHMLRTAIEHPGPAALRYPRGNGLGVALDADIRGLEIGRGELLRDGGDLAIVALGSRVAPALEAAARLAEAGIEAAVFNARFVKPLDLPAIAQLATRCGALVTVEEHALAGGFGSAVLEALAGQGIQVPTRLLAVPDTLVEHGDPAAQLARFGLDAAGIARSALGLLDACGRSRPAPGGHLRGVA